MSGEEKKSFIAVQTIPQRVKSNDRGMFSSRHEFCLGRQNLPAYANPSATKEWANYEEDEVKSDAKLPFGIGRC
jgi:hypothetical protein